MTDALLIAVIATGIVAVLIGVVTWMLVLPARASQKVERVVPFGEPPLTRAALLAERDHAVEAMVCEDLEALDREALRTTLRQFEAEEDLARASRFARVLLRLGDEDAAVRSLASRPLEHPDHLNRIEDPAWIDDLAAPGLERSLTGLMALLGPEVITWDAHPAPQYGLSRRERVESLPVPPPLATLAPEVAVAVGVPAPVLFITPDREARLVHINLAVTGRFAAALAVGGQALAFEDEAPMRFMLGRKLTFMRAEHLMCTAVDGPEDLRALHLATAHVLDPGTLPEPPEVVAGLACDDALLRLREHFSQAERAGAARRLLRAAVEDAPDPADAASVDRWERWLIASAETSFRCGLLMCGDLAAALAILDLDDLIPGTDWEHAQCYQALYGFYLSEEFAALRQCLVGANPPGA